METFQAIKEYADEYEEVSISHLCHILKVSRSGYYKWLQHQETTSEQENLHYVYDRSQRREKRDPKEIGISAVRGGSIVGEHEVLFCGQDEVIEFKHTAYSKAVFAKGAVEAAKFLKGKGAGHYDMADVIAAK